MMRIATCSCGQFRVSCAGDPELVSLCHCIACKKRTGSAYGIAAFYGKEDVEVAGDHCHYERSSDSGFGLVFHFCPTCGATVYWEPARMPDLVGVAVGAFGDPAFPAPGREVYTECRHDWIAPLSPPGE